MRAQQLLTGACLSVVVTACPSHRDAAVATPPVELRQAAPAAPAAPSESFGLLPEPVTPARPGADTAPQSLEDVRRTRRAYERLPPDGRFLRALEDLPYLLGSGDRDRVSVVADGERWDVLVKGADVAEVPDAASFSDLDQLLIARAQQLGATRDPGATTAEPAEPVLVDAALSKELTAVNDSWTHGHPTAASATRAAHAALSVAWELTDATGIADSVQARAWALHALARAEDAGAAQDEALLAADLAYSRAARSLAAQLPAANPVRLFILRDDAGLRRLADADGAGAGLRYLWLCRLVDTGTSADLDALPEAQSARSSQAFAAAFARQDSLEMHARWSLPAADLELRDLQTLGAPGANPPPSSGDFAGRYLATFETLLAAIPDRGRVPFDTEQARTASRARFYSALTDEMIGRIYDRGIASEGTALLALLGPGRGLSAVARSWLEYLTETKRNQEEAEVLPIFQRGWPQLGAAALHATLYHTIGVEVAGTPSIIAMARCDLRRLDSRPEHLAFALHDADKYLVDSGMKLRLIPKYLAVAWDPWLEAFAGWWKGDASAMERLAADASASPEDRMRAVKRLLKDKVITEDAAAVQLRQIARNASVHVKNDYAWWLRRQERWDELSSFLGPVVASRPDDDSLVAADQRAALCRALWVTGHAQEAWKVIQPALRTGKATAMYEGALAQLAVGRREEALSLAEKYRARYASGTKDPDLSRYAGILWRAGMPEEAAQALNNPDIQVSQLINGVGPVFASVFHRSVSPEEEKALDLLARSIPVAMPYVAQGMLNVHANDLAWQVASKGAAGPVRGDVQLYVEFRKVKGAADAIKWFTSRQDHAGTGFVTQEAYEWDADELGFYYQDPQDGTDEAATVWALRAASLARRGTRTGQSLSDTLKHYQGSGTEPMRPYSQVQLGLHPETSLVRLDTTPEALVRHAFTRALLEDGAGKLEAAADDYLDALELHVDTPATVWCQERIHEWYEANDSLPHLAAAAKTLPAIP